MLSGGVLTDEIRSMGEDCVNLDEESKRRRRFANISLLEWDSQTLNGGRSFQRRRVRRLAGRLKRLLRRRLRGRERSRECQKTLDVGLKVDVR
jgi:hypothetical protein